MMNTEGLKKRYSLLKKNQEVLKFEIQISQDEQKYIHVETTVENKYKKALNRAINELILEALKIALNLLDLRNITEELQEKYIEQWTSVFDFTKPYFISVLIKDGIDMYIATEMDAAYKLNSIFSTTNILLTSKRNVDSEKNCKVKKPEEKAA